MSFVVVLGLYLELLHRRSNGSNTSNERSSCELSSCTCRFRWTGFVGSDREHPGVAVSDAELKQ